MHRNFIVAGGGFAGLFTALHLNDRLSKTSINDIEGDGFTISVIRSKSVGTIGVGESIAQTILPALVKFGVDQYKFFKESNATLKLGAKFTNWHKPNDYFYHPLMSSINLFNINYKTLEWLKKNQFVYPLANNLPINESISDVLSEKNLVPFTSNLSPVPMEDHFKKHPLEAFGLHFDSIAVLEYLENFIETSKPNIKLIEGNILNWSLNSETGFVESLLLDHDRKIEGNFYFDCTGFKRLFGNKIYDLKWKDSSLIAQDTACLIENGVPWNPSDTIPLHTSITAMTNGWMFAIPLQHRIGTGYVHSSRYSNVGIDAIQSEHIKYWENKGYKNLNPGPVLKWTPGHFETPLYKNILMVGLSEGFLEPLDSNSLLLTENSLHTFMEDWNPLANFTEFEYTQYNNARNKSFEWTASILSLMHQVKNKNLNSSYWNHYKNNYPIKFSDINSFLRHPDIPEGSPFGLATLALFSSKYNLINMDRIINDDKLESQLSKQTGKEFYDTIHMYHNQLIQHPLINHNTWLNQFK